MAKLLEMLIQTLLQGSLSLLDMIFVNLIDVGLFAENNIGTFSKEYTFTEIFNLFFIFGISLILLKFLKKGFEVYILWNDGDPDADPLLLVTNFVKALAITVGFSTIYVWLADVIKNISNDVMKALSGEAHIDTAAVITAALTGGFASTITLVTAIFSLIYVILVFVFYFKFLMRGFEMLILRIGIPLACTGLIDNDKGVFRSYINKFLQSAVTIVVQIALMRLSLLMLISADFFQAIAVLALAIGSPKFIQEFMIGAGGGGGGAKATQAIHVASMLKGVLK